MPVWQGWVGRGEGREGREKIKGRREVEVGKVWERDGFQQMEEVCWESADGGVGERWR